ncbi:MAG: hypothetical protein GF317_08685 [Candidatus Lokiarchaeota archaeon]|nr:hypothetical protein [Candidatus Lokiarchaeota archaeon]MBD3199791.1 hypothetical protein [Candidatus Lokiarchaeota archaeon]
MDKKIKKTNEDGEEPSEESLGDYLLKKEFRRSQAIKKLLQEDEKSKSKKTD